MGQVLLLVVSVEDQTDGATCHAWPEDKRTSILTIEIHYLFMQ